MLGQITPLILTYNEAPNIAHTLGRLTWAREVVVLDSGSTDRTREIVAGFRNARMVVRPFTTHAEQWNFGLAETGIATDWVLALDADYVLTGELLDELGALDPDAATGGYRARFVYCIDGRPLRGTVYPPVTVLYRRVGAHYVQDGHTQRLQIPGSIAELRAPILHDDRKPIEDWLRSQARYMQLEADKLVATPISDLDFADRLRRLIVFAPPVMFFFCLFARGNILDGYRGVYYALQRTVAELILTFYLVSRTLRRSRRSPSQS
jgi:glycosyltransferase involved in cell wall biosynthesis